MSFVEFLLEYYVYILAVLVVLVIGVIGFIVDTKNNEKKKMINSVNNSNINVNNIVNDNVNTNTVSTLGDSNVNTNTEVNANVNGSVNSIDSSFGTSAVNFNSINSNSEFNNVNTVVEDTYTALTVDGGISSADNGNDTVQEMINTIPSREVVGNSVLNNNTMTGLNDVQGSQVGVDALSAQNSDMASSLGSINNVGLVSGQNFNSVQTPYSQSNVNNMWTSNTNTMMNNVSYLNANNDLNNFQNSQSVMYDSNMGMNSNSSSVNSFGSQPVDAQMAQVNDLSGYTINQSGQPVSDVTVGMSDSSSVQNTYAGVQSVNNGNFQNNNIIIPAGAPYYDGTNMYGGNQ